MQEQLFQFVSQWDSWVQVLAVSLVEAGLPAAAQSPAPASPGPATTTQPAPSAALTSPDSMSGRFDTITSSPGYPIPLTQGDGQRQVRATYAAAIGLQPGWPNALLR